MTTHIIPDDFLWAQKALPWCFKQPLNDGRELGDGRHEEKLDYRLKAAQEFISFDDKSVLEPGSCEGNITSGLCSLGAEVTAFDARLPNVLKTLCRVSLNGYKAVVYQHNAEKINEIGSRFDIIVHIGLFYHLTEPGRHLLELSQMTDVLLLDTHVAKPDAKLSQHEGNEGHWWKESVDLWSGMSAESFWLTRPALRAAAKYAGFKQCNEIFDDPTSSSGPRVLWLLQK